MNEKSQKMFINQVITLKNGEQKFVPGVTDKSTGRFVPGQIIETVSVEKKTK